MAYGAGDWMLIVRGATGTTEEWSNTWCTIANPVDVQAMVGALHDFYDNTIGDASNRWSTTTTAAQIRVVDLFTGDDEVVNWPNIAGPGGDDSLPSECAIRVSISAADNRHGGPYLPAPNLSVLDANGLVNATSQDFIRDALTTLLADWDALDVQLGLNSPGDLSVRPATAVRVGRVFDAMRSRRSDLVENYLLATLP